MSLSRKALEAMGLTKEQVDTIVEMHTETTDALKTERDRYKTEADKLPGLQSELEVLKSKGDGGYESKYNSLKSEYDKYKETVTAKESKAAKENAVKAYLESKNINGKNLNIALRGMGAEISAIELLENGKIKDATALDELIAGDFAGLVSITGQQGATVPTPPNGGGKKIFTRDEISKMTSEEINSNWDAVKESLKGSN